MKLALIQIGTFQVKLLSYVVFPNQSIIISQLVGDRSFNFGQIDELVSEINTRGYEKILIFDKNGLADTDFETSISKKVNTARFRTYSISGVGQKVPRDEASFVVVSHFLKNPN